jgi:tetratricopeptide (TPR) repeat protein
LLNLRRITLIFALAAFSDVASWAFQVNDSGSLRGLLAAAKEAAAKKDYLAAAERYRSAVMLSPKTPELWADLGLMSHQAGNYTEANKSFTEAIQLDPSLFVPQLFLGIENLQHGHVDVATVYLLKAQRINPKDLQVPLMLGRAYSISGKDAQARDWYRRAVTLAPQNADAWFGLGAAYLVQVGSDARKMTTEYRASGYVRLRAAEAFAEQGKFVQAAAAFKDAALTVPPPPCSHAAFGIILLRQELVGQAATELDAEVQAKTFCPLTALGQFALKLDQGETSEALMDLVCIWRNDPHFLRENLYLLRNAVSNARKKELLSRVAQIQSASVDSVALEHTLEVGFEPENFTLRDSVTSNQGSGEAASVAPTHDANAETLYRSGRYGACREKFRARRELMSIPSLLLLAECAYYSGDYVEASVAADVLSTRKAATPIALYWGSKADEKLASDALTRAGAIDSESPRVHVLLGDVYRQQRRWATSEEEYQKALALKPNDRTALLGLGIALLDDAKPASALSTVKSLLQVLPEDPEANLLAGEILTQQNSFQEAESYLDKGRSVDPEYLPRLHAVLGKVYARTDRPSDAIRELSLGAVSDQDGSVHYQLARLYQRAGEKEKAAQAFQISKELHEEWDSRAVVALQQSTTDVSRR